MTHAELVAAAAKWLRQHKRCTVVTTEVVAGRETADVFGWHQGRSVLVECKRTRGDFVADQKKATRTHSYMAIGRERYYLCPEGLVNVDELPPKWGLLEINGSGVIHIRRTAEVFEDADAHGEVIILLSLLRRIGKNAPDGVSISCYTYTTRNTATLGIAEDADSRPNNEVKDGNG